MYVGNARGYTGAVSAQSDGGLVEQINRDVYAAAVELGCEATLDLFFLCYLRRMARFGYFSVGPITVDVRVIEELVERNAQRGRPPILSDDYTRFSQVLMQEVRRSGRKRIDDRHLLLALMRCQEGLPARVFGELGVTPEAIERYLSEPATALDSERLLTPEEVAEHLRVQVQTVRAWIRAGTLPARRVAGLRALRIRWTDMEKLLQPLDGSE